MLSIGKIPPPSTAVEYYQKDNYFLKDEKGEQYNSWHGKGAEKLGLKGKIDGKALESILEGKLPNGQQMGRNTKDGWRYNSGRDFTFSAPKSLSLLAYVGGDKRLLQANVEAVKETLSFMEKNMLLGRVNASDQKKKMTGETRELTESLVAALFPHDISREGDPQAHIHALILNATQRENGKFGSVDFDYLYEKTLLIGQMYRYSLEGKVNKLGYETTRTHKDNRFEINGVSEELVKLFSKGSTKINKVFKTLDYQNTKTKDKIALKTRSSKKKMDMENVQVKWKIEAGEEQKTLVNLVGFSKKNGAIPHERNHSFRENVTSAKDHLAQTKTVFTRDELIKNTLSFSPAGYSLNLLNNRLDQVLNKEDVIIVPEQIGNIDKNFTTKAALVEEKNIIKLFHEGKGVMDPLAKPLKVQEHLKNSNLHSGQKEAVKHILFSQDRVVAIQGYAGTGKSYMLSQTKEILDATRKFLIFKKYNVIGLAPTLTAKNNIEPITGKENTHTLQHFLTKYNGYIEGRGLKSLKNRQAEFKDTVILVDEAGMISNKQASDLLKLGQLFKIKRIVPILDGKQHGAISAGKPISMLLKNGLKFYEMKKILRQTNEVFRGVVQGAVDHKSLGVLKAYKDLNSSIIEVKPTENRSQEETLSQEINNLFNGGADHGGKNENIRNDYALAEAAVGKYASFSESDQENTLVVASSNKYRKFANELIRNELTNQGKLQGEDRQISILENKHLSHAEQRIYRSYNEGDIILAGRDIDKYNIKQGDWFGVKKVKNRSGIVQLERIGELKEGQDNIIHWKPSDNKFSKNKDMVQQFSHETLKLKIGEQIRFIRTSEDKDFKNGDRGKIMKFGKDQDVHLKMKDGSEKILNLDSETANFIDHAYASTSYSSQSLTFKHVIGIMDSKEKNLTSQATFYVNMTRAQETATFVVDDKERVYDALKNLTGEKDSALQKLFVVDDLTKIADKKIEYDPQKEEFLLEKKDLEPEKEKSFFEELFGRTENTTTAEKETTGEPERELIKERDREAEM